MTGVRSMIEVLNYEPNRDTSKKSLSGILTILINDVEIRHGIKLFDNGNKRWVGFPSFKTVDETGKEIYKQYDMYKVPEIQKKYCMEIMRAYDLYRKPT